MKFLLSKVLLSSILSMVFVSTATASVLLEPFVGGRILGKTQSGAAKEEHSGVVFGGRLGVSRLIPGMILGIDYRTGEYDSENNAGIVTKYDASYLGAFASYTGIPLFSFWGTWVFQHNNEVLISNTTLKGQGLNLGVGYMMIPSVRINLEFSKFSLDELEFRGVIQPIKVSGSEFILTVSIPLVL